jgi:hypothetical protein
MLESTERDFVIDRLKDAIFTDMRGWFLANVNNQAFRDQLPDLATPVDLAKRAVDMSLEANATRYPGALIDILNGLDPGLNNKTAEILSKVRLLLIPALVPIGQNPVAALILAHKLIFWGRSDLRLKLQNILPVAGRSILVINGESGVGKTYTSELLTHLMLTGGPMIAPVRPPLEAGSASDVSPENLAAEIVTAMGLIANEPALPKRVGVTIGQFSDSLCRWLLQHVPPNGAVYWIVLDGFGMDGVDPWCRAFISRLASKMTGGVYKTRLRLILINYPADELTPVEDHLEKEDVQPPSDDDLKSLIACVLGTHGLQPKPQDLSNVLAEIKSRVSVSPTDRTYYKAMNAVARVVLNV